MAVGFKTGGRKKGVTNKNIIPGFSRKDLQQEVKNKYPGFNPVVELVKMFKNRKLEPTIRLTALKEATTYLFPKLKAVEITGENGDAVQTNLMVEFSNTILNEKVDGVEHK